MKKDIESLLQLNCYTDPTTVLSLDILNHLMFLLNCDKLENFKITSEKLSATHLEILNKFKNENNNVKNISTINMHGKSFHLKGLLPNKTKFILYWDNTDTLNFIYNKNYL